MGDFADDIRIGIRRYQLEGYEIRPLTPEEIQAQVKAVPRKKQTGQLQMPFAARVKQIHEVNAIVAEKRITKVAACEQIGIGYGNYKELIRKNPDIFKNDESDHTSRED